MDKKGNAGRIKRFGRRSKGGGDLLSHFRSTIGAVRFNFSVRNGKRWSPHAIAALVSLSPDIPGVMGEKERIGKSTPNFIELYLGLFRKPEAYVPDCVVSF